MHRLDVEPKFARFDARQVEELVDGLRQLFDANQRRGHELPLRAGNTIGASWSISSVIRSVVRGVWSSCEATATSSDRISSRRARSVTS